MKIKKYWGKLSRWKKGLYVGILIGFLPWQLIFLPYLIGGYSKTVRDIWLTLHVPIGIFSAFVWFLLTFIYLSKNSKLATKIVMIIWTIINIFAMSNFLLFESLLHIGG